MTEQRAQEMARAKIAADQALRVICRIADRIAECGWHTAVSKDVEGDVILAFDPRALEVLDEDFVIVDWNDAEIVAAMTVAYPDQALNMARALEAYREIVPIYEEVSTTPWPVNYHIIETPWDDPTWERKERMDRSLTKLFKYTRRLFALIRAM
ncbi:hypothetical protein [Rhizobium leguminosarum]|uniref:hypothetical protein n=1 Tax=Rhizobium leguminosarum TaxID=384 RepID=UPI001C9391B1|nr:hypothetical protein [Rhizobium leguminosarum]MBY5750804.1 hypothetical protein [Rhizobium leguminosarum]